jgi:hypothetical protein
MAASSPPSSIIRWLFTMGTSPPLQGTSVDDSLISGTSFRREQDPPAAAPFGSSQSPLGF